MAPRTSTKDHYVQQIVQRKEKFVAMRTAMVGKFKLWRKGSDQYDRLKKGFYRSTEVAVIDGAITKDEADRAIHAVKCIDQQLLLDVRHSNAIPIAIAIVQQEEQSQQQQNHYLAVKPAKLNALADAGNVRNDLHMEFVSAEDKYKDSVRCFKLQIDIANDYGCITDNDAHTHHTYMLKKRIGSAV